MTQAVSVRREGDTYQARVFWQNAIQMLDPQSSIQRVGFEFGPKSFDDVWVEHAGGATPIDHEGKPLLRDHIQSKWHVGPGQYGFRDIIDPDFINATSLSFLERARAAQLLHAPDGTGSRFRLITTHRIDCTDALCGLIHGRAHNLRLDKMWEGKTAKSATGELRSVWAKHLGITDKALRVLARTLAFTETTESLDVFRQNLAERMGWHGLKVIPASESAFIYDEIVFRWLAQGRNVFSRADFYAACKHEGLLASIKPAPVVFGVKSFEHATDPLEPRCVKTLNLLPDFYERQIRPESDWTSVIYPKLKHFLLEAAKDHASLRLALDAHITLGVAAGSILNVKSGRTIELEQRTNGRQVWSPTDTELDPSWGVWQAVQETKDPGESDLVLSVGLSTDPWPMVDAYLKRAEMTYIHRLSLTPSTGTGAASVRSGRHAIALADDLVHRVSLLRANGSFTGRVHLFMAVPNGFSFFLGQRISRLGRLTVYEYDFEGLKSNSYEPSLHFPVPAIAQ
ncbi:hypothetical protein Terro_3109 [Terriglobus roseus DSM 18391]|uniref:SMODS-associated and fused to various effectors domain-containing protein n=1 Tax=Terriglobus roseus (strain DSM 18391 / NRRL B-41598 / KBS 63) TaxID=926566 RepID=I3ZJC1_TERRK|nr:SAVED domain-containing protein [Terriglobus roseus]AFL89339.1 hypothetical protein Terro_3109 [Terriglobus roseus DSM 18391]